LILNKLIISIIKFHLQKNKPIEFICKIESKEKAQKKWLLFKIIYKTNLNSIKNI